MHVDGMRVVEVDLHEAERIVGAGLLLVGEALGGGRAPVDLRGVELLAVAAVGVDVEFDEHALALRAPSPGPWGPGPSRSPSAAGARRH